MGWSLFLTIIFIRIAYQFYRFAKKPYRPMRPELEEVIKIIEDSRGTFIHSLNNFSDIRYEVVFDVKLNTGKAQGSARLDYEQEYLAIRVTYPIPVPVKYIETCYDFIGIVNKNNKSCILELDHKMRLITIESGTAYENGIGVLPPFSEHILNNEVLHLNLYLKGIQKIIMEGFSAEEACGGVVIYK
jgi:hypothetical protein